MAAWGALGGLGAGLQQFGGAVFKAKFLDKLEEEKKIRDEEREVAREKKKVKETRLNPDNGQLEMFNSDGELIGQRAASQYELTKAKTDAEKDRITLETAALTNRKTQEELDYSPTKRSLDEQKTRADINESYARADYYENGGSGGSGGIGGGVTEADDSPAKLAGLLINENVELRNQYTTGPNASLSEIEFHEIAEAAIREAAKNKLLPGKNTDQKDPRFLFRKSLQNYKRPASAKAVYPVGKKPLDEEG